MSSPVQSPAGARPAIPLFWLILAILLAGINLRPVLTSLGPLLPEIIVDLGLSPLEAGLITTLPVLCLGLFAPPAARLADRWGQERAVALMLGLLATGIVLRSCWGEFGLFTGSLIAGSAIGVAGAIIPGIVKRDAPNHPDLMTGFYTMVLCLGAAIAAGTSVPLMQGLDDRWEASLAFWAIPAALACLLWLPLSRFSRQRQTSQRTTTKLWRNKLAWQVTLHMGLQSSIAYIVFGWLPTILQSRGLTPREAGFMLSISVLIQLITAQAGPWLATRTRDQRPAMVLMQLLVLTGLLGCLFAPHDLLWPMATILGLGMGGSFSIALVIIVLRARDAQTAGELSGMAQGFGYTLASLGPLLIGFIPQWFGGWDMAGVVFTLIVLGTCWSGWEAGKHRVI